MRPLVKQLCVESDSKIVMCVLDGLGGLPAWGKTELASARTPNLDRIARSSSCGLHIPVAHGITPGSGAAHLGLFGYDPVSVRVGRGVVEAAGLNIKIGRNDLVARGNFANVETRGGKPVLTDRRAGRISTRLSADLVSLISDSVKTAGNAKIKIYPGAEHRFVVVFTFPKPIPNGGKITDTDPQKEGVSPIAPASDCRDERTLSAISAVRRFLDRANGILKKRKNANCILLRGFSTLPDLEPFGETYRMSAACVAAYPMYRGIAGILGMEMRNPQSGDAASIVRRAETAFADFNFIYLHIKSTDRHGEDGDFKAKAQAIEQFDKLVPRLFKLKPDVLIVTGDHSTPAAMSSHSWHPVPLLIRSSRSMGGFGGFNETECRFGELGTIRSVEIMPLALAHAGRLAKFGA